MTNKQLYKTLNNQLNRLIGIKGYSVHLSYIDELNAHSYFHISICNDFHKTIYNEYVSICDSNLTEKLQKLKDFINGLFNN